MCRYSMSNYKTHYICLSCRKSVKQDWLGPKTRDIIKCPKCPECRQTLVHVGRDFKAPKRNNTNQWKKLALLVKAGILFDSCGCDGPGYRPKTLSETKRFVNGRQFSKS